MIAVDIEASGTHYEKHSMVSLGAISLDNPTMRFYGECRIWDGAHIDDEALTVCGFSIDEITDVKKMPEGELARTFTEWTQHMSNRTLAGQNVSFDRDFLKAACAREGIPFDFAHRTIDTHTLCYMHMVHRNVAPPIDPTHRRSALNLDAILNYCGIADEPQPHNALTGALSHAEVISRLMYGKKLLPEFEQFDIPW